MEAPRSRWIRFPLYMLAGFAFAAIAALLFHPHYLPLCERINSRQGLGAVPIGGGSCRPISVLSMVGFFTIGLGLVTMLLVPIVSSLIQLVRHGHNWETPRGTESAMTNLPILGGFIYLAAGVTVALAGY
jgi:predicted PurR-regulated permease PerM